MAALELILALLAAATALRFFADRWRVPYPSALVVGGALLALTPGLPTVELAPETLFLVFVPPLLYWGALTYPLRDVRNQAGAIARLAVLLVLVSAAAVAVVIHALDGAFTWASAFALGAIVAPPDPVAVLAMMRSLRLPSAVQNLLEGEGMFNDVTALVAYRIAVAAAVSGTFAFGPATATFLFTSIAGVAIGLGIGFVVLQAHRLAREATAVELTISLLTPFASYLAAERVGASGVLAVVATGLYVARVFPRVVRPQTRVQSLAMWNVVTFLLEGLLFILVGLELNEVSRSLRGTPFMTVLGEAIVVTLVVVVTRLIWMPISAYWLRAIGRAFVKKRVPAPAPRSVAFVAWAGLRGGDSLVIALALPLRTAAGAAFPGRERIIFITFVVIFASLVLQGPTLPWIARLLGLRRGRSEVAEETHARLAAAEAGLKALESEPTGEGVRPEVSRYLRRRHLQRARRWASREVGEAQSEAPWLRHEHTVGATSGADRLVDDERAREYRRLRRVMIEAELGAVLDLRDDGSIDDEVMRRIQRDLDFESMLLDAAEPVGEIGDTFSD
jgi:CPA1 family monovalent cation:H+ antiporter